MLNPCKINQHSGCKGHRRSSVLDRKTGEYTDQYITCDCICHAHLHPKRCLVCNHPGHDQAGGVCVDHDACQQRLEDTLANDNTMQKLRASKEHGKRQREIAATNTPRVQVTRMGVCEHCGEPTKGGRFIAGHDAKLKGELKRAAEAGDRDSLLELHLRNWPVHTVKVSPELLASTRLEADSLTQRWLDQRNLERTSK